METYQLAFELFQLSHHAGAEEYCQRHQLSALAIKELVTLANSQQSLRPARFLFRVIEADIHLSQEKYLLVRFPWIVKPVFEYSREDIASMSKEEISALLSITQRNFPYKGRIEDFHSQYIKLVYNNMNKKTLDKAEHLFHRKDFGTPRFTRAVNAVMAAG
ncbi:MAG: hypothetical protein GJ680_07625 [Alteromonadaceae bacterium]|nr:hypothetical protein [Alteromonadaceae bacterium]